MAKEWLTDEEEQARAARAGKWTPLEIIAVILAVIASIGVVANLII